MQYVTAENMKKALIYASDLLIENEPMLTKLDSVIGDGDHGFGMKEGFTEVKNRLSSHDYNSVYSLFKETGIELVKTMGGASGVIFGSMFTGGLSCLSEKENTSADDLIKFFENSAIVISKRGRTKSGDKTMLDAFWAAIDGMKAERIDTDNIIQIFYGAYKGAENGVEATRHMMPRAGRSKNFREKAIGLPDPGAVSTSIIFKGLYESLKNE